MRKVILGMTMTCDGFFAGPNQDPYLDWMVQTPEQELHDDLVAEIRGADAGFVGYPTACGLIPYWGNVAKNPQASPNERAIALAVNHLHKFVISRTAETLEWEHSELLLVQSDQDLVEAVTQLKQQPGRDLVVIAGIRTAQTFVRLGLIDEYHLMVHPVALGNGKRVWASRVDLKLVSVKTYPSGVMRVRYQPAQ